MTDQKREPAEGIDLPRTLDVAGCGKAVNIGLVGREEELEGRGSSDLSGDVSRGAENQPRLRVSRLGERMGDLFERRQEARGRCDQGPRLIRQHHRRKGERRNAREKCSSVPSHDRNRSLAQAALSGLSGTPVKRPITEPLGSAHSVLYAVSRHSLWRGVPMAKRQLTHVCQSCGQIHPRWVGRCEGCGAWNTLVEEVVEGTGKASRATSRKIGSSLELQPLAGDEEPEARISTTIDELDRALGGGVVPGSALLLGGDPGIGKSTLTLQAAAALAGDGRRVIYVSGEESISQIRLRARRLGLVADAGRKLELAVSGRVEDILAALRGGEPTALLVIDSIQTMHVEEMDSAPGTVGQLRAATHRLIQYAKRHGTALLLIGHVTKDGQIAGPRVLEHMVDTVLYFEGDRSHHYRILRAVKNRFGPANEIGVFEMRETGLLPVGNPSALFLGDRDEAVAGTAVLAGIEGSRPVLVEIQALVAPSPLATRRDARSSAGTVIAFRCSSRCSRPAAAL